MSEPADPAAVGPGSAPAARSDLLAEELDGELVLLEPARGGLHVLNPTAAAVWRCLDGEVTLVALADDLAAAFDADPATVRADVLALVDRLARDGLLAGAAGSARGHRGTVRPGDADGPSSGD
jgi:hypothetical protein